MKTAAPISVISVAILLSAVLVSPAMSAPKAKSREYRPLMAKAVRIEVATAVPGQRGKGAAATREGWAHFDKQEWEKAMDRFLAALETDSSDTSAAEGLTMAVYRSGDRRSAAELGEEFSLAMPWIRGMVAETVLADVKGEVERGELLSAQELVETLPHGGGAYDRVRDLVEGAMAEQAEVVKNTVAQAGNGKR